MGFLGRIFSAGTTADKIRKAYSRQDWAEVLALADSIDSVDSGSDRQQIDEMVTASGNQLARINLEQAEACLRAAEYDRAREHLELVLAHAVLRISVGRHASCLTRQTKSLRRRLDLRRRVAPAVNPDQLILPLIRRYRQTRSRLTSMRPGN